MKQFDFFKRITIGELLCLILFFLTFMFIAVPIASYVNNRILFLSPTDSKDKLIATLVGFPIIAVVTPFSCMLLLYLLEAVFHIKLSAHLPSFTRKLERQRRGQYEEDEDDTE